MKGHVLIAMLTMALTPAVTAWGAEHVVAPDGTAAGAGTLDSPWDLATALAGPASVQPGDSIVLRGGTYAGSFASALAGTEQAPITVRSHSGEWARIDLPALPDGDGLTLGGQWTIYRDFEIFVSDPTTARDSTSVAVSGTSLLLANLVIHDGGNNMFHGTGSEIYGSILYNNGTDGAFLAHHLYAQNEDPTKPSHITDCLIFNGFAFGIHAYATNGHVSGMHIVGNVWFNNGVAQTVGDRKDNCLVGTVNYPPENVTLAQNMGWAPSPSDRSVALGRYNSTNLDLAVTDNYLVGATDFTNPWQTLSMTGNTFIGPLTGAVQPASYPDNNYLAAAPSGTEVFVRPNREQPGRAHVVVYNWDGADSVEVDLSAVLSPGDLYEIRNGQNFFAPAVVSGTFDGAPVSLPMSAGDDPAQPLGPGLIEPTERTGKAFNVFVVLPQGSAPPPPPDGGAGGAAGAGASGGFAGAGGSANAGANGATSAEDSGCGCRAPGPSPTRGAGVAFGALGLAGLLRRRKVAGSLTRGRLVALLALLASACGGGKGQPEVPTVAAPEGVVLESGAPRDGALGPTAKAPSGPDPSLGASDAPERPGDPASLKLRREMLVAETTQLAALAGATAATSPDLPTVLHRLGRRYSELAMVAEADGNTGLAAEARQHALEHYQKLCSSFPNYAQRDEALFDLGTELILGKDLQRARQTMLELIDKYKDSKMVPRAYLAFGEMFFDEAGSDPTKLNLAKQAYQAVLKYPPPDNRVYGYASYKLGWVALNQGDGAAALDAFRRTIDFATQLGAGSPSITRLGEQARKDLVPAYLPVGKPETAYLFFRPLSGDDATGDKRTREMVLRLAQAYGERGMAAEASIVCQDLLRRQSDATTCQRCQQVASTLLTSADAAGQAVAQKLRSAIAQLKCGAGP